MLSSFQKQSQKISKIRFSPFLHKFLLFLEKRYSNFMHLIIFLGGIFSQFFFSSLSVCNLYEVYGRKMFRRSVLQPAAAHSSNYWLKFFVTRALRGSTPSEWLHNSRAQSVGTYSVRVGSKMVTNRNP